MQLKLIKKRGEVPNVSSFLFSAKPLFHWKAGQYMHYRLEDPRPDERKFDRFFSIASAPYEGHLMITTRFVPGDGSTFKRDLRSLDIGDTIEASGPMGKFIIEDPLQEYIFIAGGIGVTPYRAMLLDLDHKKKPINITLLYASRNRDIIFKKELEEIAKRNPKLKIHYILDPDRIDKNIIKKFVPDLEKPYFYLSGPEPMVEAMKKMLEGLGITKEKIKTDYFPGYTEI